MLIKYSGNVRLRRQDKEVSEIMNRHLLTMTLRLLALSKSSTSEVD